MSCIESGKCAETHKCARAGPEDPFNTWFAKILEADSIILGSPTHFANVSVEMKSLIDRCGFMNITGGEMLKHKIGAAVVAVRRGGAASVFDELNKFFTYAQIHVASSCYWNNGIGRLPGEVQNDEEGVRIMKTLGKNMAYLLKKMNDPRTADIKPPA
ncbi:MAG: putative NADPH-dependent FMN reductase [Streblomastix strix]|uniref:Putative NADPH-dependent FMN reductase n=1 Tax=Streblomastix strix TaxID=222440 RepID=A0A5J4WRW1_9EUKA|nr:MAG: putative NADPH-dependent FMN reductase [Streblomastix strix]